MKKMMFAAAALAIVSSAAFADGHAIEARKAVMKNTGAAVGALAKMVKGEAEYDALAAQLAMRTIHSSAVGFESLFPKGTETGGETTASPKIWEDMGGFAKASSKFASDAAGAIEAAGGGLDSLKGAFGPVVGNCKGCHEAYRVKKN